MNFSPYHVLLEALVLAAAAPGPEVPSPTVVVAVDFSGLDLETFSTIDGTTLEQLLVIRLTQEGFAVVSVERNPAIVVRLGSTEANAELVVESSTARLSARVEATANISEFHLEIAQRTTELVSRLSQKTASREAATQRVFHFALSAGVQKTRRGAGDPVLALRLGYSHAGPLVFHMVAQFSQSGDQDLRIREMTTAVGAGWRTPLSRGNMGVVGGASVGLLYHSGRFAPALASTSRIDPIVEVFTGLRYAFTSSVAAELNLLAAFTSARRTYRLDGGVLWAAQRWRAVTTLGAEYIF